MKNTWPNYLPGPKHLTLGLHIHQTTCQLPEGSSSRVVAQPQRKFSVSVQERKVSKVSKEPTKHGNKIRTEPTQLNHYSLVKSTRGAPRYFSDGKGRVLSEEERAAENVYIQAWPLISPFPISLPLSYCYYILLGC
jgi:hypothetical protein